MDIEIEDYMNSINLECVCRTCLSDGDEMTSLFSEVVIEDPQIEDSADTFVFLYEIVANVSALQLLTDEGLPTSICKKCIEYATIAYKFKVNCERTESLLQTYVTRRTSTEELSSKTNHEPDDMPDEVRIEFDSQTQENNQNQLSEEQEQLEEPINEDQFINSEVHEETEGGEKQCIEVNQLNSQLEVIKEEYEEQYPEEFQEEDGEDHEQLHEEENEEIYEENVLIVTGTVSENTFHEDDFENVDQQVLEESNSTESHEFLVAADVASTEDNIKLRQKIEMKKKKLLENESEEEQIKIKKEHLKNSTFNEKGQRIYICPICKKEYRHSTSLTVHIRSHNVENSYLCEICNKSFKQMTGLTHHMRSHSGEQPYHCNLCDKKYRQPASLKAHMRVHTGQRPYLCSVCGKGFRQAPDLGYHMRTHTNEKPYMCNVCGKRMSMQCHLVQHMRTHTGEKPYSCSKCGKCFASTTRLKRHEIIHTDCKPFVCSVCGKAFNRASTLRVHSMLHTEERPHVCHLCGKGFIQAHCLRTHLNSHKT